jgi:hypothetical protein
MGSILDAAHAGVKRLRSAAGRVYQPTRASF